MILVSFMNVSKCPMMYSLIIFSIVHRLLIGLYEPISYIGLPVLCLGDILSILNNFWECFLPYNLCGEVC